MIVPALGYDPRPQLSSWRGTPIPSVSCPLPLTPMRSRIAERVWWNGPPWTIVRNADNYVWRVMDYGLDDDIDYEWRTLAEEVWLHALEVAKPRGDLSRGSWLFWSNVLRRWSPERYEEAVRLPWPDTAHRLDYKHLATATREELYRRQAYGHYEAKGFCDECAHERIEASAANDWRGVLAGFSEWPDSGCCRAYAELCRRRKDAPITR